MAVVKKQKSFLKETDLCAHFLSGIGDDWVSYAETAGWDILLVRKQDGFQVGIQAKLKLNAHVVSQCIEEGYGYHADSSGPDCRAVLVPEDDCGPFDKIAGFIGFTIIRVFAPGKYQEKSRFFNHVFRPDLPEIKDEWKNDRWFECAPSKRHKLPEYVPDVQAGAAAPIQLTKWKISAIKIAVTLERRGFLTRADFKHHQIDYRRFIAKDYGWLVVVEGKYLLGPKFPDFKIQHPVVYEKIASEYPKWQLKSEPLGAAT